MKKEVIKVIITLLGGGSWLLLPFKRTYFTRRTAPAGGNFPLSTGNIYQKSLAHISQQPVALGSSARGWYAFFNLKKSLVSLAPYSLKVTAEHCLILMGLTAFSPFVVPWFRALPPWNDYSIAHLPLNVNTFFQKIYWKFLPVPGHFISLNRGSAPHFRGALSTIR